MPLNCTFKKGEKGKLYVIYISLLFKATEGGILFKNCFHSWKTLLQEEEKTALILQNYSGLKSCYLIGYQEGYP